MLLQSVGVTDGEEDFRLALGGDRRCVDRVDVEEHRLERNVRHWTFLSKIIEKTLKFLSDVVGVSSMVVVRLKEVQCFVQDHFVSKETNGRSCRCERSRCRTIEVVGID